MNNLPAINYPYDYTFRNNSFTDYETKIVNFKSEDICKNYPAQSYYTHSNHSVCIPEISESTYCCIIGDIKNFYIMSGGSIQPYGINSDNHLVSIEEMSVMIDVHCCSSTDLVQCDQFWDYTSFDMKMNQTALLYQDRRLIRNIKVYLVIQRKDTNYSDFEDAVLHGARIVKSFNFLPENPVNLKIENEVLHINEDLRAYFHIMFDAQWVVQFRKKYIGKINNGNYDISHTNYVVDLVTVSRNKIIFTTN